MRWQLGLVGTLLGAVTGLGADPPRTALPPSPPRSARLLAPQLLDSEKPEVSPETQLVRAQGESLPPLGMTPVRRSPMASPPARPVQPAPPAWLRGIAEPESVLPAAASVPSTASGPPSTAEAQNRRTYGDSLLLPAARLFSRPAVHSTSTPTATAANPPPPHAQTPFRGTNAQGATIYAGPPAYRWYGYGAATPPAFLVQTQGQYPKASADWYHITGATAGAFPIPVLAPPAPAASPPLPNSGSGSTIIPNLSGPSLPTQPAPTETAPPAIRPTPPQLSLSSQHTSAPPTAVSQLPTPSLSPTVLLHDFAPPPPSASLMPPTAVSVLPASANVPARPEATSIPPSVDRATPSSSLSSPPVQESPSISPPEHSLWKPATQQPAQGKPILFPLSTVEPIRMNLPGVPPVIARAQVEDDLPDFVTMLIAQLTAGQVRSLKTRWISPKRLEISWVSSHPAEAERLVRLISSRPELAPIHLDFHITIR